MPIGDMAWIARSGTLEIMLGTIVERKEVNDLASSLFGTRYKEQRLRLQHCGLPQVILLVEGDTKEVSNCSHESLHMAMMETRVQLDFQVVRTRHLEDTVRFLKSVHRRILQRSFPSAFSGGATSSSLLPTFSSSGVNRKRRRTSIKKTDVSDRRSFVEMVFDEPPAPPFGASRFITYNELKFKVEKDREEGTKTIGGIFCRMLKQIPRISNSTVPLLVHSYRTPDALFRALEGLNVSAGKSLLADLETGTQKVGELRALEVYYTFMSGGDDSFIAGPLPCTQSTEMEKEPYVSSLNIPIECEPILQSPRSMRPHASSNNTQSVSSAEAIDLLDSSGPWIEGSDEPLRHMTKSGKAEKPCSQHQRHCSHSSFSPSLEGSEIQVHSALFVHGAAPSTGLAERSDPGSNRNAVKKRRFSKVRARESIDSLDIEVAMLSTRPKGFSVPMGSQSSDDDDKACRYKSLTLQGATSSDSEEEEPLEVRLRRREKLDQVHEVVATDGPSLIRKVARSRATIPVAREVSISEDDDSIRVIEPEVIELSD